jgi:hypothetical protein
MQNMPIWVFFTGCVMKMLLLRVENTAYGALTAQYQIQEFASVYCKLRETGALPSSYISSERANEQNVDEAESILQSVEGSPKRSTRRISKLIGVWRTAYVSTACILLIYR